MIRKILDDKPSRLFIFFTAFFVANALIAECIGSKIFSLESTLGFKPFSFSLFGQSGLSFTLTCGVLLWPLEFVMTDIVNEFYGPKAVRRISYTAVALISYAYLMFFLATRKRFLPDFGLSVTKPAEFPICRQHSMVYSAKACESSSAAWWPSW